MVLFALTTIAFAWLSMRNAKPVCDALIYKTEYARQILYCETRLGEITPDEADVIHR